MIENDFSSCLFFTATRLQKISYKIAEDEFEKLGMSPSYVYILLGVHLKPGITQKELCQELHLMPSTLTRLLDKLILKGLVEKKQDGKTSHIYLTEKGIELKNNIDELRFKLHDRYKQILGEENYQILIKLTNESAKLLELLY